MRRAIQVTSLTIQTTVDHVRQATVPRRPLIEYPTTNISLASETPCNEKNKHIVKEGKTNEIAPRQLQCRVQF